MKRTAVAVAAIATLLVVRPSAAQVRPTAQEEQQAAQFLVGTWSCAHTVGDFSGTYTTTFANALGDQWLKQTYDFPATRERAAGTQADYFIRYDPRVPQWVRFGAMSDGMYFAMVGKRAGNVWSWSYVLPGRSGSAVYTKQSDSEFTIDGPSYPENGKMVTEHHTCRKSS